MARKLSDQGSAGELEPLAELYNKLLSFLSNECAMILDVAERTLAVPTIGNGSIAAVFLGGEKKKVKLGGVGYELLTSVVWDEIASRLMSELGHVIFAAGQPSVFHRVRHHCISARRTLIIACRTELLSHSRVHLSTGGDLSLPSIPRHLPYPSDNAYLPETLPTPRLLPTSFQRNRYDRRASSAIVDRAQSVGGGVDILDE